jgi:putative spermidine/putrescine transport system permease protein
MSAARLWPRWLSWALQAPAWLWMGALVLAPFLWPAGELVLESARQPPGVWREFLDDPSLAAAWWTMMKLSAGSSVMALALAVCLLSLGQPEGRWRQAWLEACNIAASFAGIPLVLGLGILLGSGGVLQPVLALAGLSWDVYAPGGLMLAFLAFQVPLAVLLMAGPVQALDKGWWEAAALLGASPSRYWWRVALPTLRPSLLQAFLLLMANAAASYATPFALLGTGANIWAVRMTTVVSGDIFAQPELAQAMALLLFLTLLVLMAAAAWAGRRVEAAGGKR